MSLQEIVDAHLGLGPGDREAIVAGVIPDHVQARQITDARQIAVAFTVVAAASVLGLTWLGGWVGLAGGLVLAVPLLGYASWSVAMRREDLATGRTRTHEGVVAFLRLPQGPFAIRVGSTLLPWPGTPVDGVAGLEATAYVTERGRAVLALVLSAQETVASEDAVRPRAAIDV